MLKLDLPQAEPLNEWLAISLDGFAQQNAARPPEHLVKELVQNSLDAMPESGGMIHLNLEAKGRDQVLIQCHDTGEGVDNLDAMRTMFWTSKQDSHLKRGRMGRGFKEMLCLATEASVRSGNCTAIYWIDDNGNRRRAEELADTPTEGTLINMTMPWSLKEVADPLRHYFHRFLMPPGIQLAYCGEWVTAREAVYRVETKLTTECFTNNRWVKRPLSTILELYPVREGESEGHIYEMGIPVCPVEWDLPYHVNVLQRVPMNPNRDAVMTGYATRLHKACLPVLIDSMNEEEAKAGWVGKAASDLDDADLKRRILQKGFGDNLARKVPGFGKFDFNADAQEQAGAKILDLRQLPGGFREMARELLPTSKEVVEQVQAAKLMAAAKGVNFEAPQADARPWLHRYGKERVKEILHFHQWLSQGIMEILGLEVIVTTKPGLLAATAAEATWTYENSILTLSLECPRIWERPMCADNFSLIIHETAHEIAFHHGEAFHEALERTGGAACRVLMEQAGELAKWRSRFELTPSTETTALLAEV